MLAATGRRKDRVLLEIDVRFYEKNLNFYRTLKTVDALS